MNYYINGDAAKADQIKAAFEKLGFDVGNNSCAQKGLYFTFDGKVCYTDDYVYTRDMMLETFIKKDPNYQELELPNPHYDIANFQPFDKVLVRDDDNECWMPSLFGWVDSGLQDGKFVCGTSDWYQCIPFEDNEHLLGTTDMPSEEYINW